MSSTQPGASPCYIKEMVRSMGAALDVQSDAKNDSSELHAPKDTEPETPKNDTTEKKIAVIFTEAVDSPATPPESPTDISVHKTHDINPVKSGDTSTKAHSASHKETASPPDLSSTMEKLIRVPNSILKEHYGERIHFLAAADENSNAMIWSIKTDDVLLPIAILTRTLPDGSLEILRNEDKSNRIGSLGVFEERGEKLLEIGDTIQATYACDHIGFYDGENIVLLASCPGRGKGTFVTVACQDEVRSRLVTWLGEAIGKAKVKMLKPLTGYTLEESSIAALGLGDPPQRLLNDDHIDLELLIKINVKFGGSKFKMYTTQDGRIITVENHPLPMGEAQDIATAIGVRKSSQEPLTDLLVLIGKEHVGDQLKYSNDLVRDALVWYVRNPGDRSKEFVAVLQFAAAGTIVPGDWGLRNRDLTFTNGEGIVRTAKPLLKNMLLLGQRQGCFTMALFDYHNLVIVTRSKAAKVKASIVLITGGRIRGALVQWLLRALEIAEDTFPAVD